MAGLNALRGRGLDAATMEHLLDAITAAGQKAANTSAIWGAITEALF